MPEENTHLDLYTKGLVEEKREEVQSMTITNIQHRPSSWNYTPDNHQVTVNTVPTVPSNHR